MIHSTQSYPRLKVGSAFAFLGCLGSWPLVVPEYTSPFPHREPPLYRSKLDALTYPICLRWLSLPNPLHNPSSRSFSNAPLPIENLETYAANKRLTKELLHRLRHRNPKKIYDLLQLGTIACNSKIRGWFERERIMRQKRWLVAALALYLSTNLGCATHRESQPIRFADCAQKQGNQHRTWLNSGCQNPLSNCAVRQMQN